MRHTAPADGLLCDHVSVMYLVNEVRWMLCPEHNKQVRVHMGLSWGAGCSEARDKEQNMEQEPTTLLFLIERWENLLVQGEQRRPQGLPA